MPKVSVIVPVYNVAPYIEQCVRSLFEQTLDDIEYIFVNDCTPDNSMEILYKVLEEYPRRKGQTTIIHHECNKGSVAARQTAVAVAVGDFIIACDSDDWIEMDMYEKMYATAELEYADMVWCDYYRDSVKQQRIVSLEYSCDPIIYVKGMMTQRIPGFLCNKLFRKELFQRYINIGVMGADMWEDLCITIPMTHHSRTIVHVEEPLYHYRYNINSIAQKTSILKRTQDMICNAKIITDVLRKENLVELYTPEIHILQLAAKYNMLYPVKPSLKDWRTTFSEANRYLKLASNFSFHHRMLQYSALYNFTWAFIIRNYLRSLLDYFVK